MLVVTELIVSGTQCIPVFLPPYGFIYIAKSFIWLVYYAVHDTVVDLRQGSYGPKFLSISCSFSENLAKSYVGAPWRVGTLSYGESWIHPCNVSFMTRLSRCH